MRNLSILKTLSASAIIAAGLGVSGCAEEVAEKEVKSCECMMHGKKMCTCHMGHCDMHHHHHKKGHKGHKHHHHHHHKK